MTIEKTKELSEVKIEDLQSIIKAYELDVIKRNNNKEKKCLIAEFKKN